MHLKKLFKNQFSRWDDVDTDQNSYCKSQDAEHGQVTIGYVLDMDQSVKSHWQTHK